MNTLWELPSLLWVLFSYFTLWVVLVVVLVVFVEPSSLVTVEVLVLQKQIHFIFNENHPQIYFLIAQFMLKFSFKPRFCLRFDRRWAAVEHHKISRLLFKCFFYIFLWWQRRVKWSIPAWSFWFHTWISDKINKYKKITIYLKKNPHQTWKCAALFKKERKKKIYLFV